MHLRRAILLFALVLGLTALATSIAPTQRGATTDTGSSPPPPPPASGEVILPITFAAPPPGSAPRRTIRAGQHVIVQVTAAQPGQATIPGLGQAAPVDPHTPASFDLLPAAGRYDVIFSPSTGGPPVIVGMLTATR